MARRGTWSGRRGGRGRGRNQREHANGGCGVGAGGYGGGRGNCTPYFVQPGSDPMGTNSVRRSKRLRSQNRVLRRCRFCPDSWSSTSINLQRRAHASVSVVEAMPSFVMEGAGGGHEAVDACVSEVSSNFGEAEQHVAVGNVLPEEVAPVVEVNPIFGQHVDQQNQLPERVDPIIEETEGIILRKGWMRKCFFYPFFEPEYRLIKGIHAEGKTDVHGKEYLEDHPDLAAELKAVEGNKAKVLALLKAFMFWKVEAKKAKKKALIFKPWKDGSFMEKLNGMEMPQII